MNRVFFATELEGVATWWSIRRRDGVTLGFTSHDRDIAFGGIRYRCAPGMVPSAIRRTASLERDAVEVEGVLAHDAISAEDLEQGRYADARVAIGVVDWETLEHATLFHGRLGNVSQEDGKFEAELRSAKSDLEVDFVPRTSPTCRAGFCDAACGLSPARFTHLGTVSAIVMVANTVTFAAAIPAQWLLRGQLKWLDGPLAGVTMRVIDIDGTALVLDRLLLDGVSVGHRAMLREGCDHTLATCSSRFGNAVNFRGEPHLPGNDLLARYPTSSG